MSDVCPVERAGSLDNSFRRFFQNPRKILRPYIKEGMTVLDLGCGPGFFSVAMAQMVGASGRVIAADLQEGMLARLKDKVQNTDLEKRIKLHKCAADKIGVSEEVDFALAFYVIHEILDREKVLNEVRSILKPSGRLLIVEPKLFHVTKEAFEETVKSAREVGFEVGERPPVFLSRAVALRKV